MRSIYFPHLFLLLLLLGQQAQAQNTPNGATAPSGTASIITAPDEVDPGVDPNYVKTYVPMLPFTSFITPPANTPAGQVRKVVAFKDGFSRTFQTVQEQVATINGQAKHLVQLYDNRFRKEQYSFLPYGANSGGNFQYNAFLAQKNYYLSKYPGEDYTAYSHNSNTSSDTARSVTTYLPGRSQTGQNRGTVTRKITNAPVQVRIWTLDGNGLPVSTAWYPSGELFGEEVLMPGTDGNINAASPASRAFTDKEGRTVLKMMADSNYVTTGGVPQTWITYQRTYYVYDDMGRLTYILSPRAVELIENNSWVIPSGVLDNLCFRYTYDSKGMKIAQKQPGKAWEYFVNDNMGRQVLYQDSLLRKDNKWLFSISDGQNRPVCTGLYQENTTRQVLQDRFTDGQTYTTPNLFGYLKNYNLKFDYPSVITSAEILSYNYYDNYNYSDPGDGLWSSFSQNSLTVSELQSTIGSETPLRSPRTQGRLTGSKVKILPSPTASTAVTGEWKQSAVFYDDKGRVIYAASRDLYQNNSIHTDYVTTQYDFAGRILISKHIHGNSNATDGTQHTELTKNEYDPGSTKLLTVKHKVDNGNWNILSSYTYDDMGQVSRKILGNGGEVQDFNYNIRGQLAGINARYAETGFKDGVSRSFGEALKYDYGFTRVRYDGRMSGLLWRGSGTDGLSGSTYSQGYAYGYDYDQSGRLKQADFRMQLNSGSTLTPWSNSTLDFSVSNLFYDKNGNILSMKQRGTQPGTGPVDMDVLSYRYVNNNMSNQLLAVTDGGVADYGAGDFQNGTTGTNDDYTYDGNGNLGKDLNKKINTVTYTFFNKPQTIQYTDGSSIEYSYDAGGSKVQELIKPNGQPIKRTDYLGNFVYRKDSLEYVLTGEGRTIVTPTPNNDSTKEEYFVKDHLGNVRSTIDVVTYLTRNYLATWEIASANLEGLIFDNLNEVRDSKPGSTDPKDASSARLNGAETNHRIGASLLLQVMAGDKIGLSVNNYYDPGYLQENDQPISSNDMLAAVVSTLTTGNGGFEGSESHNTELVNKLFSPDNYSAFQNTINNTTDGARPKAFLNYVFFDENMNIVTQYSGAIQANGNGTWATIGTQAPIEIPINGYMGVYLSNSSSILTCGSCSNVFFDQLLVEVSKGNLLEENHYYPHGLPITISSQTADGFKEQRRRYQGNEYIKDLGLNWMDFQARQYDPQTGRFLGIDPLATSGGQEKNSPYAAMGNAPESQVDPNGTEPITKGSIYFTGVSHVLSENWGGNGSGGWKKMSDAVNGTGGAEAGGSGGGASGDVEHYDGAAAQQKLIEMTGGSTTAIAGNGVAANNDMVNTDGETGSGAVSPSEESLAEVQESATDAPSASDPGDGSPKKQPKEQSTNNNTTGDSQCSSCTDPNTVGKNFAGTNYIGPNNPKTKSGDWDYSIPPKNRADGNAFIHDKAYDKAQVAGASGLLFSTKVLPADAIFTVAQMKLTFSKDATLTERYQSFVSGNILGIATMPKVFIYGGKTILNVFSMGTLFKK